MGRATKPDSIFIAELKFATEGEELDRLYEDIKTKEAGTLGSSMISGFKDYNYRRTVKMQWPVPFSFDNHIFGFSTTRIVDHAQGAFLGKSTAKQYRWTPSIKVPEGLLAQDVDAVKGLHAFVRHGGTQRWHLVATIKITPQPPQTGGHEKMRVKTNPDRTTQATTEDAHAISRSDLDGAIHQLANKTQQALASLTLKMSSLDEATSKIAEDLSGLPDKMQSMLAPLRTRWTQHEAQLRALEGAINQASIPEKKVTQQTATLSILAELLHAVATRQNDDEIYALIAKAIIEETKSYTI